MKMKKTIGLLILALVMLLTACSSGGAGINQAVTHENLSVQITKVFGDEKNAYILFEANVSEAESVTNGRLSTAIVNVKSAGGYSFSLIGRSEETHTQTYLLKVSGDKRLAGKKMGVSLSDYRSEENLMENLIEAGMEWAFEFTYQPEKVTASSDSMLANISLYGGVLVITPKDADAWEEIKEAGGLDVVDVKGELLTPILCSADETRCYLSEIVYVFDPAVAQNIDGIRVGELTYGLIIP